MKNYERFFKLAVIDYLGKMNRNLKQNPKPLCGTACIMYALNTGINDYDRMVRCKKHDADCDKCIAAWLQEDVR